MLKNTRIALINPPAPFLIKQRVFPNLGLLDLATAQIAKGEDISVIDLCESENPIKEIKEIANEFDIFGFSSTTPQFIETYNLHQTLKRANPNAKTIIGGPHPSAIYSLIKAGRYDDPNIKPLNEFDYIVAGEGEELDLSSLQKGWTVTPIIKDMNKLQIPNRSLMDITSYKYNVNNKPTTTIMTQRGCPFQCTFCCGRDIDMYNKVRSKSPENVLAELDYLHSEFGFDSFSWFDDELNVNPSRLLELSKKLQTRDYIHRGLIRSDLLVKYPETLEALADAGFAELTTGVESGSEKILQIIQKGVTSDTNSKAAQMIMEKGISYKAFIIIGNPGETYEDIEKTKKWIKDNNPDGIGVSILSPYPGSKIYNHSTPSTKYKGFDREWNGLFFKEIDYSLEESFFRGKPGEYTCNIRTNELSSEDLIKIRDDIEKN